jgi:hypothetical protein
MSLNRHGPCTERELVGRTNVQSGLDACAQAGFAEMTVEGAAVNVPDTLLRVMKGIRSRVYQELAAASGDAQ